MNESSGSSREGGGPASTAPCGQSAPGDSKRLRGPRRLDVFRDFLTPQEIAALIGGSGLLILGALAWVYRIWSLGKGG